MNHISEMVRMKNKSVDEVIINMATNKSIHHSLLWNGHFRYRGTFGGEHVYALYNKLYWFDNDSKHEGVTGTYLNLVMVTPRWAKYYDGHREVLDKFSLESYKR